MPTNRTQMWLARLSICMGVILLIVLKFWGLGSIETTTDGPAKIYHQSPTAIIFPFMLAVIISIVGIVYLLQPRRLYRVISVVLFSIAVIFLVTVVPIPFFHRVVVTDQYFSQRIGYWFAPNEQMLRFDQLLYLHVVSDSNAQNLRTDKLQYVLECRLKPKGNIVTIPLQDLMKKALPEIYIQAAKKGVVIGYEIE